MPQSRPPAYVIYAARYLVPRTFLLARGVPALSAVDLDGGAPVLLVPLPRAADASLAAGAGECWNRHAPEGSPRALAVVCEGSAAFLVAEATVSTAPIRVRTPGERTRLRAQAAAIGASLDAAGLALPDASVADLGLASDELCLARPAVPAVEAGPKLATVLPLLIPEPALEPLVGRDQTRPARTSPGRVRRSVRPLTLGAAITASAVGYAIVGAALPQRGGVEPASAARTGAASAASPHTPLPAAKAPAPAPSRPESAQSPAARGGPAVPLRQQPGSARAAPPPAQPPSPHPGATVTRVARAASRPPAQPSRALPPAAVPQVPATSPQLPLAPTIPA